MHENYHWARDQVLDNSPRPGGHLKDKTLWPCPRKDLALALSFLAHEVVGNLLSLWVR